MTIEMDIDNFDRTVLIKELIEKHEIALKTLKTEQAEKNKIHTDQKELKEKALENRNSLNKEVEQLKEIRKKYYWEVNNLRRNFFILMEKLDDIEKLSNTIVGYRKQLEEMDWKIQTSALTIDSERKIIDNMKNIYSQITFANKESQQKLGIETELSDLTIKIGENLTKAQDTHELLIKKAEESEIYHNKYIQNSKELSEHSNNLNRINRKISRNQESLDYWNVWVKKGDSSE